MSPSLQKNAAEQIAWGMDAKGNAVHIGQVQRGRACGCVCIDCGRTLVAYKGSVNVWHFQHDALSYCRGESALHLAGKQALVDAAVRGDSIEIPKSSGCTELTDDLGQDFAIEWDIPAESPPVIDAGMEITLAPDVRADVVADLDGRGMSMAIEIRVTHEKDALDCQAYQRIDQDALEIDLSGLAWNATPDDVRSAVLGQCRG